MSVTLQTVQGGAEGLADTIEAALMVPAEIKMEANMTDGKTFYEVQEAWPAGWVVEEYPLMKETDQFFFAIINDTACRMRKDGSLFRDKSETLRECHRRNLQERQKRLDEIGIIDKLLAETAKQIDELNREHCE